MIGATDPPLSEEGVAAAKALGASLAETVFDRVVASPLKRAMATARLIIGESEAPLPSRVEAADGLREIFLGEWEGLTSAEAKSRWPEIWAARGLSPAGVAPPGGESLKDLAARVWPAFDSIARGPGRNVLVVAHQAVNRVILARYRGMALSEAPAIEQPYGAVTVLACKLASGRS
jgi:probable phosphoglycerate mutase